MDYQLGELFSLKFGHQDKTSASFYFDNSFAFIGNLHDRIDVTLEIENNELIVQIFNWDQKVFEKKKIFSKFPAGITFEGVKLTTERLLPFKCDAVITQTFLTKKPTFMILFNVLSWFKAVFTKQFLTSVGKFMKRNWIAISLFVILFISLLVLLFKINKLDHRLEAANFKLAKQKTAYDSLLNLRNVERLTIQVEIDYLTRKLAEINSKTNASQTLFDSLINQPATTDNYLEKLRAVRQYINKRGNQTDRR